ncbi:TolC family protein [Aquabacterium sp.]|uniref:TolC family protein n=1 Tax=Aquabacterium sp. TaxID=1872578 RepID=UPI0019AC3096|nr:TolC family protein [Aquabacterium sp.]MBC7699243.1 TolC family protein [Aquabacterium sp.]
MFTDFLPLAQRGAILLLAGSAWAFNAHAQDTLDFDQALGLSQARSRQLAAQDHAVAAARDMAVAAGQRPDPTLTLGISNLPIDGPDRFSLGRDFMTMRSVGVMQEYTREDKRLARSRRFEREAQASEASRALALSNLQRDTAVAWLERHFQERMLALLKAQRDETRLQVEAAEAAYRGGRGAQADVFAARSALAQLDDRIEQAERLVRTAKTLLARWTGDDLNKPLGAPPDTSSVRLQQANLENELAIGHPEVAVMARQEEVAQADADLARANQHADWSVAFMLSHRGPGYSNMASLSVSVPLQWDQANRQDRELSAKLAITDQWHAQREEAVRDHLAQVRATLQAWQSGRDRLSRYDATLMPLAAERSNATLAAYRGGGMPLASVLEARRMALDTGMERLSLEMETARLWAQLNFLIPADHDVATPRP